MAAFESYTQLQTDIEEELMRDDLATGAAARMIKLCEAQLNREIRALEMEEVTTLTLNARYVSLPADWEDTISIQLQDSGNHRLNLVSRHTMDAMRQANENTSGVPTHYCHTDEQLEVYPTPDASYVADFAYHIRIPALSDTQATNWVLLKHPDVYFYGSLLHSAMYLEEDERLQGWATLYGAALQSFKKHCQRRKFSGPLRMKVRGLG